MPQGDLDRQAAGLLTVGFEGTTVSPDLEGLLRRGVGGVILFSRNVGSPADVYALTRQIRRVAGRPLLIGVDQEGGVVRRFKRGFTELPPLRTLGQTADSALAMDLGRVIGRELRAVGCNLNYAPVLDIDTNPQNPVIGSRSLGQTAELVSRLGVALAQGMEAEGVAACGKHFPGHGDTSQDSHLELPRLAHDLTRLEAVELVPFAAASRAKISAIMTAHVVFDALDPDLPATLSPKVVRQILRERLGFTGLVLSDDLEMKAIAGRYAIEEIVVRGLNAGIEQFLCCHTAELAHRAIEAAVRGVEGGAVAPNVLDAASRRAAELAAKYAPVEDDADLSLLDSTPHRAVVERIRTRAEARSS